MWKGRFTEETHEAVRRFTQSLDVDWRLAAADIRGSVAHVRMLAHIGLLTSEEARTLEEQLFAIGRDIDAGILVPKESLEDVHMNIEAALIERCGSLGAKLHAGRSRNDQVATTMRLFLREALLDAWGHLEILLETLQQKAREHCDVVVPGYTHLQQAQPISMGQYWMAYFWAFLRDAERLLAAYHSCDACPLGAGALAGSTLPLDREFTARDLGFSRITENSMDSVAQRDYLLMCTISSSPSGCMRAGLRRTSSSTAVPNSDGSNFPMPSVRDPASCPRKKTPTCWNSFGEGRDSLWDT